MELFPPQLRFLTTRDDFSVAEFAGSRPIMTPEERARQQIDLLLQQSGWIVQNRSGISPPLDASPPKLNEKQDMNYTETLPDGTILGDVQGISPGTLFRDRRELHDRKLHRGLMRGIAPHGSSIVLSGGYVDDEDPWRVNSTG
jgi:SAD/SRA domain